MLTGTSYFSRKTQKDNLDVNQSSYEFIEDIMEEKHLPVEERELFWREFAIPYMNDVNFRYQTHGKYIIFNYNKYAGVVDSKEQARILFPGRGREISYIGDDKIHGRAYNYVKCNMDPESDERGAYKVNMNIRFQCGFRHTEKYTFDTGCTDTYCFLPKNWDTELLIFAKLKRDGIPQEVFDELTQ